MNDPWVEIKMGTSAEKPTLLRRKHGYWTDKKHWLLANSKGYSITYCAKLFVVFLFSVFHTMIYILESFWCIYYLAYARYDLRLVIFSQLSWLEGSEITLIKFCELKYFSWPRLTKFSIEMLDNRFLLHGFIILGTKKWWEQADWVKRTLARSRGWVII